MAMPIEIVTVPCLSDNYAYLVHDETSGATALVDAPEAAPILEALDSRGWALQDVWITHHHADHTQALAEILKQYPAKVRGAAADAHRLPPLDAAYADEDRFTFGGEKVCVMDVSGHTIGHIAYYLEDTHAVFSADSLMALGCGRLFEGTAEQMWASMNKFMALPPETLVFSGHEYTAANAKFALTIDPDNADLKARVAAVTKARLENVPTVPSSMAEELATNPFLRAKDSAIRSILNKKEATDAEVFGEIRARKDVF
jgi:hydroxyacylglutathione hydrolase